MLLLMSFRPHFDSPTFESFRPHYFDEEYRSFYAPSLNFGKLKSFESIVDLLGLFYVIRFHAVRSNLGHYECCG